MVCVAGGKCLTGGKSQERRACVYDSPYGDDGSVSVAVARVSLRARVNAFEHARFSPSRLERKRHVMHHVIGFWR